MLIGFVGLKRILDRFNIPGHISYLAVSLAALSYFSVEPVYFIASFGQHFSWAATVWMCYLALVAFQRDRVSFQAIVGIVLLYWIAALVNAQNALTPLAFLPLALIPVYRSRKNAYLSVVVISLTSVAFLIRKFIFSIEYHINPLGWVDYSVDRVLSGLLRYAQSLTAFELNFGVVDTFLVGGLATVFVFVGNDVSARKDRGDVGFYALFSGLFVLSLITVLLIKHGPPRYFFSPTTFLLPMLVSALYHRLNSGLFQVSMLALLMVLFIQRAGFVGENYEPLKRAYADFSREFSRTLSDLPDHSQFLIIDHPIHELTRGYHHWSTRLAWQLTGNRTLSGIFGDSGDPSDIVAEAHWASRNGVGFRKKNSGLDPDRRTFVYLFDGSNKRLEPARVIDVRGDRPKRLMVNEFDRLIEADVADLSGDAGRVVHLKSYDNDIEDIEFDAILEYP
jgi:hypothetical protein